jgi:hypothetical protein
VRSECTAVFAAALGTAQPLPTTAPGLDSGASSGANAATAAAFRSAVATVSNGPFTGPIASVSRM